MANLRIAELDFDNIKTNLKNYLSTYQDSDGNPLFTDFSFEGTNWSILLDLLAYNTHYNAYLANMLMNEMFLDSAVKRASAVSIAKHLGYTPTSARGAKAVVSFNVITPTGSPSSLTLPRFTPFITSIDNTNYTFVNLQPITISPVNGTYSFNNVEITEGSPLQIKHTVVSPGPAEKYEIPNSNIDTTSIKVSVQVSSVDNTTTTYTLADDTLEVTGTSTSYFLEENSSGLYQIYFGDDVLGKKLTAGNIVIIEYLICSGPAANISSDIEQQFTTTSLIGGGTVSSISAISNSTGGVNKETITSIKFRAPRFSSSQNRAVTNEDYKAIIESSFPYVESVSVWGGEENDPPKYGKVMISLKPYDGYVVSESVKASVTDTILKNKKMMSITPEFVDPEYLYIGASVRVIYNPARTTYTSNDIKNLVINTIQEYFKDNLQQFSNDFVYSQLVTDIDNTEKSIVGNITTLKLQKRITPVLGANYSYSGTNKIKFYNGIEPGTVRSTRYNVVINSVIYPIVIKDVPDTNPPDLNGTGTLKLYNADTNLELDDNYGSVDYAAGEIDIPLFSAYAYPSDIADVRFTASVQDSYLNIQASKSQILVLDDTTTSSISNKVQGLVVDVVAA